MDRLQIPMTFSQMYPVHLRTLSRTICGLLLGFALLYVLPHLLGISSSASVAADISGAAGSSAAAAKFAGRDLFFSHDGACVVSPPVHSAIDTVSPRDVSPSCGAASHDGAGIHCVIFVCWAFCLWVVPVQATPADWTRETRP